MLEMPVVMPVALTEKLVGKLVVSPQKRVAIPVDRHPAAHEALALMSFVGSASSSGYLKSLVGSWMSLNDAVV